MQQLEAYLGMSEIELTAEGARLTGDVGLKIKSLQANGNNLSGFNLLMAGSVQDEDINAFGERGRFGTKSIYDGLFWYRYIDIYENYSGRTLSDFSQSMSVRCIMD